MARPSVFEAQFAYDDSDPPGYRSGVARVGADAGGSENSVRLFELPPGQAVSPYHYEYLEEWLLVLAGPVSVRGTDGEETLESGALACFPRGPQGAHKVSNPGGQTARVLMWSSAQEPAIAVYPDSDKIGVWPGNPDDELMLRRADGHVPYFDGESGD
jgi:uncharacterized cupin superfamily protein